MNSSATLKVEDEAPVGNTEDWRRPPALTIAQHIVDHAQDGAIILLHDGANDRFRTVLGLDVALDELSERSYSYELMC